MGGMVLATSFCSDMLKLKKYGFKPHLCLPIILQIKFDLPCEDLIIFEIFQNFAYVSIEAELKIPWNFENNALCYMAM